MDHLWSPWRLHYVTGEKPSGGCVFCAPSDRADSRSPDDLVVFEGNSTVVVLNRYPYNNGHVMVLPRRHVATLVDLSSEELQELARLVRRTEAALREAYSPQGINIGVNLGAAAGAGITEHLHVHLVPRWSGDTNFMTVVGTTRVLPEDLPSTARRLRPIFERLSSLD